MVSLFKLNFKTPFLRLFANFYGHLGICVYPFTRPYIVYHLWNIFLNGFTVFRLLIHHIFAFPISLSQEHKEKPLFYLLRRFNRKLFSFGCMASILYFAFFGPKILQRIDSFRHLRKVAIPHEKTLFTCVLIVMHTNFAFGYYAIFFNLNFLQCATIYLSYLYFILPLFLLHFLVFAKNREINYILRHLDGLTIEKITKEIQYIAALNGSLQRFLAPPLTFFLVTNTIDIIVCLCLGGLDNEYSFIAYSLLNLLYLLMILQLEFNCQSLFGQLQVRCRLKSQHLPRGDTFIRLHGIAIYKYALTLNLFALVPIDFSLLLNLSLFSLNYTVLILQTQR